MGMAGQEEEVGRLLLSQLCSAFIHSIPGINLTANTHWTCAKSCVKHSGHSILSDFYSSIQWVLLLSPLSDKDIEAG